MIPLLLGAVLLCAPAGATVKLPTLQQLAQVVRGGDEVEIERLAHRLGAARLRRAASNPTASREERLAALRALPLADGAWGELSPLAALLREPELADAAAAAAHRIAEELTPRQAFDGEVPPDVPREAARALWSAGGSTDLSPSLRARAIAAAAPLIALLPGKALDGAPFAPLLGDPDPEVRRAAVESLAGAAGQAPRLERALADPEPSVAAAAGAALCGPLTPLPSRTPAERAAASLAEPARARVRTLVADPATSLVDRLDLVPCLRLFATPTDKKILDALGKGDDEHLKRRARAFSGR